MNTVISIIGATILVLVAFFIFRGKSRAKKTNDYFCDAVRVYALTEEEGARLAILTAAKVAAKKQRGSMVRYLQSMAADMEKVSRDKAAVKPHVDKFIKASTGLVEEISSRDWTASDISKQKKELQSVNPQYLAALENADPTIFRNVHPQLFK